HLLITGASGGIGQEAALGLAAGFSHMTLLGRDPLRHRRVLDDLDGRGVCAELVECDLTSLAAVSAAAARIRSSDPIDVAIANAGIGGQRGVTDDGFEVGAGVDRLAHHLLVTEVADRIRERVVLVSSNVHYDSPGLDLARMRQSAPSRSGIPGYRASKLVNV